MTQFYGRKGLQAKVRPTLHEFDDILECVDAQPIVAVVGHVGHKNHNLKRNEDSVIFCLQKMEGMVVA